VKPKTPPSLPADAQSIVESARRELKRVGWRAVPAKDYKRLKEAREYDYYWYKAAKRVDIRGIDGFGALAARAIEEHRTGMKYDRLYTLWQAVARLADGTAPLIEIGAFRGGSAYFVAEALQWHGRANPFFVCDTIHGHAVVDGDADSVHRVGEQFVNTSFEDVAAYLAPFPNIRLIQGDFRVTSEQIAGAGPFAFAHVDVDVYPVTGHALEFIASRMRSGGWIVVDDYGFTTCPGAKQAVDEFAAAHPEFSAMHLLTGQAVLIRVAGP
jgi:predicted O-methyltransferase YrrM